MATANFDAFISYSRVPSASLALAVHDGIERFAKPWNRQRVSRVFLDDASMPASAALWSNIEEGLSQSEWLVLLASPEAAGSEYVNREVAWWVANRSAERILLVQSSGEISWDSPRNDFDTIITDSIPPPLRGAFEEEPRWIDMRWFADEGAAGTQDPRFTERIADLVATIRDIDRDALIGESVREHRRSRRLARSAISALAVLLVAALGAGTYATFQAVEASRQRDEAQRQAEIATAGQLAAVAQSLTESDPTLARLLAARAFKMSDSAQSRAALLSTVRSSSETAAQFNAGASITAIAPSADGSKIVVGTESGEIAAWQLDEPASFTLGKLDGPIGSLSVNEDGSVIVAQAVMRGEQEHGVYAAYWVDGEQRALPEQAVASVAVSPTGNTIAYSAASVGVVQAGADGTYASLQVPADAPRQVGMLAVPDDQTIVVDSGLGERMNTTWLSLDGSGVISQASGGGFAPRYLAPVMNPAGRFVAGLMWNADGGDAVVDVYSTTAGTETGNATRLGAYVGSAATAIAVSADGGLTAVADSGRLYISETVGAAEMPIITRVLDGAGTVISSSVLAFAGDERLASATGSTLTLWNLSASDSLQQAFETEYGFVSEAGWGPSLDLNEGGTAAIGTYIEADSTVDSSIWYHLEERSWTGGGNLSFLDWRDNDTAYFQGPSGIALYNRAMDAPRATISVDFLVDYLAEACDTSVHACQSIEITDARYVQQNDTLIISANWYGGRVFRLNATTGEVMNQFSAAVDSISRSGDFGVGLALDEAGSWTGAVLVTDLRDGTSHPIALEGVPRARYDDDHLVLSDDVETHVMSEDGRVKLGTVASSSLYTTVSPDGDLVARFNTEGSIVLSSISTGLTLQTFPTGTISEAKPAITFSPDGNHLATLIDADASGTGEHGTMYTFDLNPDHWLTMACTTAGRDLTEAEWTRFTGQEPPTSLSCD